MSHNSPNPQHAAPRSVPRQVVSLIVLLAVMVAGAWTSSLIERSFGDVQVTQLRVMTEHNEPMTMKLYRPSWVTPDKPAPGILALHGYQAEKDSTTLFGTIELARRGFVVLSFDHFGHGDSTTAPVNAKILSGADSAYRYLTSLPIVSRDALGVFGHSTGSIYAVRLAEQHPEIGATVALSGNGSDPAIPKLRNYLLVQGSAEEIPPYRERTWPVTALDRNDKRVAAFGRTAEGVVEWNVTYGDFSDGSARRAELVPASHLGVMIAGQSNAATVDWFGKAFQDKLDQSHWIDPGQQIYLWKELTNFVVFVALLLSLVPALGLLLRVPWFRTAQIGEGTWQGPRRGGLLGIAAINIVLTMVLFPFFTQWGGGSDPVASAIPFLPLEMGNGIMLWLIASTVISAAMFLWWRYAGAGKQLSSADMGLTPASGRPAPAIVAGFGLAAALVAWLMLVTAVFRWAGLGEIRTIWPLFRGLTTERALYLLPYFIIIWLFFFVINGLTVSIVARVPEAGRSPVKLWLVRTGWAIAVLITGLALLWLIHFVPLFAASTPGMEALGLGTYGGRWMMMLFVIIPQFIALIAVTTWVQIRSRSLWTAVTLGAALFTWMVVGSQVGRF